MNEQGKYGILWGKWLGGFAAFVWIAATYLALLAGIVMLGVSFAKDTARPDVAGALAGVFLSSMFHWMVFSGIEHGHIKHMNNRQ